MHIPRTTTALLFAASAAALTFSCKKDQVPATVLPCITKFVDTSDSDTVQPSPYLMAYPGSEWNYDDGSTETCTAWEPVGIVHTTYNQSGCKTVYTHHTVLPLTSFGYVQDVNRLINYGPEYPTATNQLLATVPGIFCDKHYKVGSGESVGFADDVRTSELLSTMDVLGVTYSDVVHTHVEYAIFYPHVNNGPTLSADYYYARDIGLIRSIEIHNAYTEERNLVSYTIGPH